MKKIYEEFLKIPKNEKIRDKVMMTRISLSIATMVLCLGAMGITAYAYFSCNITSAVTTIQSARYTLDVEVKEVVQTGNENAGVATVAEAVVSEGATESNASENVQPIVITPNEEGYYVFENVSTEENLEVTDKTYEFVLRKPEEATASVGFGKFEIITDVNEADSSRQLYYTTPIGEYLENGQSVENNEYKLNILVPANKTVKVKVIAEWGTCAREPIPVDEDKQIPTLIPDFKDSKYMHISFDDVSHSLLRLKNDSYTSLYDESFFAWLKTLHDTYGAKFSIYTYVSTLQQVPDTFKEDFATAKDWLKIGLHAKDAGSSYVGSDYETGKDVWNQFAENVLRITGTYDSIDRMPKLENSAGTLEILKGMRDADLDSEYKYGAIGFLVDNADSNAYYLDAETWNTLRTNDFYIDGISAEPISSDDEATTGFVFVSTDIILGSLDVDLVKRQEQYVAATSLHSCLAFMHEGQFYNENGFIDDAEGNTELLKRQVEELCQFANSNGIKFNYPQTRDFAAIQALKDAEKAAKEVAEKATQEVVEQESAVNEQTETQSETAGTQSEMQFGTQSEILPDTSNETDTDTKSEQTSDNKSEEESSE